MSFRQFKKWTIAVSPGIVFALSAMIGLPAGRAQAHQYELIKIADTAGPLKNIFPYPAVNGSGQVAYVASFDSSTALALYRGDGTTTTTIATSNFASTTFGTDQVINNAGEVAYFDSSGATSVFKGSGGPVTTIANSTNFTYIGSWGPSINDNGVVVFPGMLKATGRKGIYSGNGGAVTTIVDTAGQFSDFGLSPAVNDSGTVAFSAISKATGLWGIYTIHEGTITPIADTLGPIADFYAGAVTINDAGMVAFVADLDDGGMAIYRGNGQTLEKVVDTSGPFAYLGSQPMINNLGNVGFVGGLDGVGGWGIYDGPDPVNDKIVKAGDIINGESVGYGGEPMGMCYGDNGWVTFIGQQSINAQTLYAAHPVPEPSAVLLIAMSVVGVAASVAQRRIRQSR